MKAALDHLAISSDLLRAVAESLGAAELPGEAAKARQVWRGLQVARRSSTARLSEADAIVLDVAHRAYSVLLAEAIRGSGPSLAHVLAVLAAVENFFAFEIEDTEVTRAAILRLSWRAALNARRAGRRVEDKIAWIVGGSDDPNGAPICEEHLPPVA